MTPEEREKDRVRGEHISGWIGLLTALAFAATAFMFAVQAFLWLKHGTWYPASIALALSWFDFDYRLLTSTSWQGVNQIVAWALELHMGVGLIVAAIIVGFCTGEVVDLFSNWKIQKLSNRL
jgi:hypothetical protein